MLPAPDTWPFWVIVALVYLAIAIVEALHEEVDPRRPVRRTRVGNDNHLVRGDRNANGTQ